MVKVFNAINSFITSGSGVNLLLIMIILPVLLAVLTFALSKKAVTGRTIVFIIAAAINLLAAIALFLGEDMTMIIPWAGFEINLALRVYGFSKFMVLAVAIFGLLVALYSASFMRDKKNAGLFESYYLINLALVNGAFLANNMVVMLFFWEGMLVTLFGMLMLGKRHDMKAAVKALVLSGIADLLLMLGIAITCTQAGSLMMDVIADIPLEGPAVLGFICMLLGAAGKAGAMPFHSWIPDAADEAPLPFMAILPAAFEEMLGIYLMGRIAIDFFDFQPGCSISLLMMIIGAVTIVLAVAMALIQTDMKRMLSYQTISQVGYMILGIGTALPVGIIGGLFHMINSVIYKCCLFLTAGAVEKQTGTTDLNKLRGLGRFMPLTAVCFLIAALSISGVPPFNGFFSKELIFDAAVESNIIFYIAAALGAFLTAVCFIKVGHSLFFGKPVLPDELKETEVREAPGAMLLPMIVLAALCLVFGAGNVIPLSVIQPILGDTLAGASFIGWPSSFALVGISIAILLLAAANHIFGYRRTGSAINAADHIHYLPVLHQVYDLAERHCFDPYNIIMFCVKALAFVCFYLDKAINWIYDSFIVNAMTATTKAMRSFNNGNMGKYISWVFAGFAVLLVMFIFLV